MVFIAEELFVVFIEAELPFTQEQSSVVIEPRLVVEEEVALAVQHLKLVKALINLCDQSLKIKYQETKETVQLSLLTIFSERH